MYHPTQHRPAGGARGLPPTDICIGDLFPDEDIAYAQAMLAADVPVDLHVSRACFTPPRRTSRRAALSRRWNADQHDALRRALERR